MTQRKNGEIIIPGDRYFPEGVTVTSDGTFFVGSLYNGCIMKAKPGSGMMEPFIEDGTNGLISVLGLWADEARNTLWACSSDVGNGKLTGSAPVGIKSFELDTGAARGSYDFPGGGFANDLTLDKQGNVYVTDSLSPRILLLRSGESKLEEWINDPGLGEGDWCLNGIDYDANDNVIYVVNQRDGLLFRIPVNQDGSAGEPVLIQTSLELRRPDGLKVIGSNLLATAEGGAGGVAVIAVQGNTAQVRRIPAGLDNVTTFAYYQDSAWVVEGQSGHFWDPDNAGPDANPPFRIVEVSLE